ncbi:MAG: sulfatase [Fuerstiella sp.]
MTRTRGILMVLLWGLMSVAVADRPSVLWIYVDDMSDWVGCYGDPIVQTPHIDSLAAEGVRFDAAFMPAPVCSTTRSALITGSMQTTHGLHQHRTMIKKPLSDELLTVPELFRAAGYLTFNEAKDDYNFVRDRDRMYSPEFRRPGYRSHLKGRDVSWLSQLQGRTFFGQIQLAGGKFGGETGSKYPASSRVAASQVTVPPQYPDDPVIRNAMARHYEQILETDAQVGAIIAALKQYELWDSTVVFFFTDHGCPLPRSKQFLYEDGTKVPLIVRWPQSEATDRERGAVRSDLVSGIDIAATSLALAGIEVPSVMEGRDLFAENFEPRPYVISARDRLGIAVDRMRAVRTTEFRYIRNYHTDRALYQSQYRDGYATFRKLRDLLEEGLLSPLQSSDFDKDQRPAEELYELSSDPHQIVNLADDPAYEAELKRHRGYLKKWEDETDDQGRYPESRASLERVYREAKGKVTAPEFDFLKTKLRN